MFRLRDLKFLRMNFDLSRPQTLREAHHGLQQLHREISRHKRLQARALAVPTPQQAPLHMKHSHLDLSQPTTTFSALSTRT